MEPEDPTSGDNSRTWQRRSLSRILRGLQFTSNLAEGVDPDDTLHSLHIHSEGDNQGHLNAFPPGSREEISGKNRKEKTAEANTAAPEKNYVAEYSRATSQQPDQLRSITSILWFMPHLGPPRKTAKRDMKKATADAHGDFEDFYKEWWDIARRSVQRGIWMGQISTDI
ncbi:hypothetical protein P152DRAFT_115500 [Eremomyces bilateralis CBS 781.70]|uniref:Uncharacterized protein n=1 Tax=Eremomyces bilateralis CBS 781.70 TaxID=1392243 RepID=A0A6G1GDX7_9PEZI|nr:uncharacterized protein P152DRAFT_115500 [Eremomyces bilateralis CBS 781.70]KAF1816243.1 hypothetical protein P152DRAFT_115500 [Eremomyces bilateralis CBS 781.70]